jgi:hypothetical protein
MEEAQLEYASKRGISEADCENCNKNLVGTIKPYNKHLIVCAGSASSWLPVIATQAPGDKVAHAVKKDVKYTVAPNKPVFFSFADIRLLGLSKNITKALVKVPPVCC